MAENNNIERLAASLTLTERQNLYDKLKSRSSLNSDYLYFENPEQKIFQNFSDQYDRLPWHIRFWYSIKSIFSGKSPRALHEDSNIVRLGRSIDESSPGLYNYHTGKLLPPFQAHLSRLKEAVRFFYTALDVSFTRDAGSFYAFLGSLEMPYVHDKLCRGTDPLQITSKNPDINGDELYELTQEAMEEAFDRIDDSKRSVMYNNARTLHCLKQLSTFLFDRMIMEFTYDSAYKGPCCKISAIKEQLMLLNNILYSLRNPPHISLLGSLFVFMLQERTGQLEFDINNEMQTLQRKADAALSVIIDFNKNIPLTKILRCGIRDTSVTPEEISGGENWYMEYKEYWKQYTNSIVSGFLRRKRHDELYDAFINHFRIQKLKKLENVISDVNPDAIPFKGEIFLSFLLTFSSEIINSDIDNVLMPILAEGKFIRKDYQVDYAESFNTINGLENNITAFDQKISPAGAFGARYSLALKEISALPVKKRKMQIVIEETSNEAMEIIEGVRKAVRNIINILSNYEEITEKKPLFLNSLGKTLEKFIRMLEIMEDIEIGQNWGTIDYE